MEYTNQYDVSVMSFNILSWDTSLQGFDTPIARLPYVVETVRRYDPDIIGMQEVCQRHCEEATFDWYEALTHALQTNGIYEGHAAIQDEGYRLKMLLISCGLVIFYKKDRFSLIDSGCQQYTGNKVRYYQWVKLYDKKYDREIVFTNTHLAIDSESPEQTYEGGCIMRRDEARELQSFWKQNVSGKTVLFATGDYNSDLSTMEAPALKADNLFLPSCALAAESDGTEGIDFCYTSPTSFIVDRYKVIRDTFEDLSPIKGSDGTYIYRVSDHYPIMTYGRYKK